MLKGHTCEPGTGRVWGDGGPSINRLLCPWTTRIASGSLESAGVSIFNRAQTAPMASRCLQVRSMPSSTLTAGSYPSSARAFSMLK